ncbi:alpha/beta-hydrolase [Pluteus cervinus]|uniref:Alpha/beta-hydrolase n=1 Tax=Pluteus cervinus TaxID=181527 RepID=A0ACD3ACK0_9AGAR|nr:alpha/beta-hydrolase [Pluteus cervinus]
MTITPQSYVFQNGQLKLTAKKYTTKQSPKNASGVTLMFAHCIGSHKEQWEPIIEQLFHHQQSKVDPFHRIREAWAFDWQSHGDAALLNAQVLQEREDTVSAFEWADAIATFVAWLLKHEPNHRLVAVGHSAGAGAMTLTTKALVSPQLSPYPYSALILVEPTIVTWELFHQHHDDRIESMHLAVSSTSMRRDSWPSRDNAFQYFKKRWPWSQWDERVLRLYCEHGLHSVSEQVSPRLPSSAPSSSSPSVPFSTPSINPSITSYKTAVTLKCNRNHEALSFPDADPHFESAIQLSRISHILPVHIIWGSQNEIVPEFIQDSLSDTSAGRFTASVTRIPDGGHLLVQEQPDKVAEVICNIIDTLSPSHTTSSSSASPFAAESSSPFSSSTSPMGVREPPLSSPSSRSDPHAKPNTPPASRVQRIQKPTGHRLPASSRL